MLKETFSVKHFERQYIVYRGAGQINLLKTRSRSKKGLEKANIPKVKVLTINLKMDTSK